MEQAPQNLAPKNAVEAPPRPADIKATGLDLAFIINLIAKGMYLENIEEVSQITQAIKLSTNIVNGATQEMLDHGFVYVQKKTLA